MQSKLPLSKCNINPSIMTTEWSTICKYLTSQQAVRFLHRFTSSIIDHLKAGNRISDDFCHVFLEKRVAYDVLNGRKITNSKNLTLYRSLDLLHKKIINLNQESLLKPKHVSLSLNSYAKFYNGLTSNSHLNKFNLITTNHLNNYVSQLLKIATKNIEYMNEQDLSLVLNCISKMNIKNHEFLNSSNDLLNRSLEEFNRLGLDLEDVPSSNNLIKNMSPQGIALLLNCFSKCDVELNRNVLNFILDHYIPKMEHKFSINHLIMSLHGFLKYNVPLVKLIGSLKASDKMLSECGDNYDMKLISFALYTLSKYNFYPSLSIENMMAYLNQTNLSRVSEVEICNVYNALGKLNIRDSEPLDHMNASTVSKLKKFTPHAIVGIYHSLSRLDYKHIFIEKPSLENHVDASKEEYSSLTLEDQFILEFVKFFKDKSPLSSMFNPSSNLTLLPIQLINFTFSCAINYNMEAWIYNYLLNKLVCIIETCPSEHEKFQKNNILISYREELRNEDDQYKFLSKYVGIRGIYQLNCILQHVRNYVKGGLNALDYSVLSSINSLFDNFLFAAEGNKKLFMEDTIIEYEREDDDFLKARNEPVTSKIHGNVYSVLERILISPDSDSTELDDKTYKLEDSRLFIYKEHEAVPYVIDIVVFKF